MSETETAPVAGSDAEEAEETETTSAEAMLEMIVMKEDEIKRRVARAENDAQMMVEEAKLDAASKKRQAATSEVGTDIRDKEMERAGVEADKIAAETAARCEEIKAKGLTHLDEAVRIVVDGVLP